MWALLGGALVLAAMLGGVLGLKVLEKLIVIMMRMFRR